MLDNFCTAYCVLQHFYTLVSILTRVKIIYLSNKYVAKKASCLGYSIIFFSYDCFLPLHNSRSKIWKNPNNTALRCDQILTTISVIFSVEFQIYESGGLKQGSKD